MNNILALVFSKIIFFSKSLLWVEAFAFVLAFRLNYCTWNIFRGRFLIILRRVIYYHLLLNNRLQRSWRDSSINSLIIIIIRFRIVINNTLVLLYYLLLWNRIKVILICVLIHLKLYNFNYVFLFLAKLRSTSILMLINPLWIVNNLLRMKVLILWGLKFLLLIILLIYLILHD